MFTGVNRITLQTNFSIHFILVFSHQNFIHVDKWQVFEIPKSNCKFNKREAETLLDFIYAYTVKFIINYYSLRTLKYKCFGISTWFFFNFNQSHMSCHIPKSESALHKKMRYRHY